MTPDERSELKVHRQENPESQSAVCEDLHLSRCVLMFADSMTARGRKLLCNVPNVGLPCSKRAAHCSESCWMVVVGRTPRVLGSAPISGQHTVRKSCRGAERSERSLACVRLVAGFSFGFIIVCVPVVFCYF